jgi:hypothetical protein
MKMERNNCLNINENLEVKLLVLSVYDDIAEEIKRMDSIAYTHTETPVYPELLIKMRNVFFVIGNREKFKELNSEIYGYHESDTLPEYRHIAVYQEQSEHSSVPDGRKSLHQKEHYIKIEDYPCRVPIIKIYEKEKDDHTRKEIQREIYQNVLNSSQDYLWYIMEEYFKEDSNN